MLAVFLIALFGLVIIGVPIAFSLVGTGFFMMLTQAINRPSAWSVFALAQKFVNGTDSVPLLAIPFFMIAGEIMTRGGISRRIVDFAYSVLGRFKGGLGYVGILACRRLWFRCGGYHGCWLHDAAHHGRRRLR